jgi:hypothetical protein
VTIHENNLNLTVDYGVPAGNKNLTLDFGANADADIPSQIEKIVSDAADKGAIISGMVTSRAIIGKLRNNAAIQTAINGTAGVGVLISRAELENYLAEEFGINQVITNDLTYGASATIGANGRPSITTSRYFPKDKVAFFAGNAGGRLGIGLWGDSPEADVAQLLNVSQSGVSPYVYITQWCEDDPAVLWTKASSLFMPVLYNPDSLFIATASDGEGA